MMDYLKPSEHKYMCIVAKAALGNVHVLVCPIKPTEVCIHGNQKVEK